MSCRGCRLNELLIEIKAEGAFNRNLLREATGHVRFRNALLQQTEDETVTIDEIGARELADFCSHHMDIEGIWFRLPEGPWKPMHELAAVLETKWVDKLIAEQRVAIHFQIIVDAQERVHAYEALARFVDDNGSLLYPNEVFTAARARGRLYALDRLCRLQAVQAAVPLRTKTFINFIPTSIYSPEFCLKSTVELAARLNIDPSLFVFEVVETEKTEDLEHLKHILTFYKNKGFHYALDDVGEGFSTVEVLAELKPHYMKLDRKYVQGVAGDEPKQRTAELFLQTALRIGSVPLAEGIESREDFEWLKQQGYELFQGYLFGKPSLIPNSQQEGRHAHAESSYVASYDTGRSQ
ncbi:EAL domain-containing protein [Paenibacillus sp. PR3]|uniref:EAL domain-containing protein n=1 Tax=Paenibacillus terricola TaxID=2763503 RepID=A0ABR8MWL7_9BACL|nr:EAL domain-containing protein [Paenibacillus terricola]MBD3920363.1 EAL domain-containing protein [Paenibacillus terricola]